MYLVIYSERDSFRKMNYVTGASVRRVVCRLSFRCLKPIKKKQKQMQYIRATVFPVALYVVKRGGLKNTINKWRKSLSVLYLIWNLLKRKWMFVVVSRLCLDCVSCCHWLLTQCWQFLWCLFRVGSFTGNITNLKKTTGIYVINNINRRNQNPDEYTNTRTTYVYPKFYIYSFYLFHFMLF